MKEKTEEMYNNLCKIESFRQFLSDFVPKKPILKLGLTNSHYSGPMPLREFLISQLSLVCILAIPAILAYGALSYTKDVSRSFGISETTVTTLFPILSAFCILLSNNYFRGSGYPRLEVNLRCRKQEILDNGQALEAIFEYMLKNKNMYHCNGHEFEQYLCPITHTIMSNPVILVSPKKGVEQFCDLSALQRWCNNGKNTTNPLTNDTLSDETLHLLQTDPEKLVDTGKKNEIINKMEALLANAQHQNPAKIFSKYKNKESASVKPGIESATCSASPCD